MSAPPTAPAERLAPSRELWRALLGLLLLPLLLVGPSLLPGQRFLPLAPVGFEPLASEFPEAAAVAWSGANFLAADGLFPVLSDALAMRAALAQGELPLWDPTLGLGAPLFAQSMFGALYPLHWLAFLIEPDLALGWIALADLLLAGLGMYLFARRLKLSFGAALVGAAVFQAAGFASANLHDLMKVEAGAWLPWSLWAIERLLARERGALACLAGSIALSFLAGFPPIAIFCAAAAGAYLLLRASRGARSLRAGLQGAGALALGLGLAAIQWVPTAEALGQSTRTPRADPVHAADGLPLAANLTLLAPEVFGRADEAVFSPSNAGLWWLARAGEREIAANGNLLEWNLFAGALALALGAAALCARPRAALFPALLALFSLGFAQGWPGFALLRALPGFDLGSPARAGVLAWCAWAWLAALGAQALLSRERGALAAPLAAAFFLALGAALSWCADGASWTAALPATLAQRFEVSLETVRGLLSDAELMRAAERARDSGWALAGFASLALVGTLGLCKLRRATARPPAWLLLFALVGAEGAFYARVHLAPRAIGPALLPESAGMSALRQAAGDGRVLRFDESESGVGDVLELARPNLPQAYGIADLSPYVVLTPRRAVEVWAAADPAARWRNGVSRISRLELLAHPALDVLRVSAVLARRPIAHPRLEPVLEREGFCVYRRSAVPPRARWLTTAIATPPLASPLDLIGARMSDPARQTLLAPGTPHWPCDGEAAPGEVLIESQSRSRLVLRAKGEGSGWLVLADAWYPGWNASVDGRPVPIVAVDHALRGVALASGEHRVEFEYAPGSLRLGLLLSLLCAAGLLLLERSVRRSQALS